MEPTPNIQTRQPAESSMENVMLRALKHYVDNLKASQKEQHDKLNTLHLQNEMTNYQAKAKFQAKREAQARLRQALTEQITDRHKRDTDEKQY